MVSPYASRYHLSVVFLPLKLGGLGVGSALQRHAAAPWRAWQSIIPTLMATTQTPDTDSLFSSTPRLRAQLAQLQTTLSQQMNKPTFQVKPLGAALRQKNTQKKQVSTIQRNIHKQFYNSLTDTPTEQAILLSQSTSQTRAHLMQPSSEAYEAEDRCFRVSVARRLMLPEEVLIAGMQLLGDALRTSFNLIVAPRYSLNRRYLLSPVLSTDRLNMLGWILSFNLNGSVTYLDVSIVAPFSCSPSLVSAACTRPGLMAKRAEKKKFDRYPHINLVPFILETKGRPAPHAKMFISYLMRDADNPPLAIRDTWSTIQSVLHSAISKQQLTAAVT